MKEKQRNDTRTLTVHGNQWEYKIGRNTVAIYDPEGNRYFPKFTEIMGDRSLPNYSPHMNPAVILNYIQESILVDKTINRCRRCKTEKSDVYLRTNPFAAEIHADYTKHYLCNDCCHNLAEEI